MKQARTIVTLCLPTLVRNGVAILFLSVICSWAFTAHAAITLDASATSSSGSALATTMPLMMPSPVPSGDICVAHLAVSGDNIITTPAGWVRIREDINGHQATQGLYWHLTQASEPAGYTWSANGQVFFEGGIACYSGVNSLAPVDPGAPKGSGAIANGTVITVPSITTQTNGDLIIGAFMVTEFSFGEGVVINLPKALVMRWRMTDTNASFVASAAGDVSQGYKGPTNSLTVSTTNGQSGDGVVAQMVALQPANPPPSPTGVTFLAALRGSGISNSSYEMALGMPTTPSGVICIAQLALLGSDPVTPPAGWNTIRADMFGNLASQWLYWHLVQLREPSDYKWTAAKSGVPYEGGISCYAGVNIFAPLDPGAPKGVGAVGNGTTIAAPSAAMQTPGDLVIATFAAFESNFDQGDVVNLPASLNPRWNMTDASASYIAAAAGDEAESSIGSSASPTITTTNGQPGDGLIAQQVALQPANPIVTGIAFVGSASSSSGSTPSSNLILNMPSSLPAGAICIAHLAALGNDILGVPTGWNTIRADFLGYQLTQGLYWHLAQSNEQVNYLWTTSSATFYEGGIGCYSGVNTSLPIDPGAPNGMALTATGTAITAPSINIQNRGDAIIAAFVVSESHFGQGDKIVLPASLSGRWNMVDTDANFLASAAGDQVQNYTGATGQLAVQIRNGQSSDGLIAQDVALQPANPPPPSNGVAFLAATVSGSGFTTPSRLTMRMPSQSSAPAGNICVAQISLTTNARLNVPSGWTAIRQDPNFAGGAQGLFWRRTGLSDPVSYTWTTSGGAQTYYEGAVSCYSGVNNRTPIDPGAPSGSGAVATGSFMVAESNWAQGVTLSPSGTLTQRWNLNDSYAGFLASASADQAQSTAGSTGPLTATTINSQPTDGLIGQEVALQRSSP